MTYPRPIILADEDQLRQFLDNLAELDMDPIASGMDLDGRAFLALISTEGDRTYHEVIWDNPVFTQKEWKSDDNICKHCGSVTVHFPIGDISYPVTLLTTAHDVAIPEGGTGEPVVEQPPPVDELLAEVEADDAAKSNKGKGNTK